MMIRRSQSLRRLSAENNDWCHDNLHHSNNNSNKANSKASSSFLSSTATGWFNNGKADNNMLSSMTHEMMLQYEPRKRSVSHRTSIGSCCSNTSPPQQQQQQQQLLAQEITQSHCVEQRFLSKMRESGVVTSAGYQAVLHDFLTNSDREISRTDAAADNIDRRAELCQARKASSYRSSRRGSSRRFSSFFTACASSCDDEDFLVAAAASAFSNEAPDATTIASSTLIDKRAEMLNARRRSSRRGSSRRFGSFFTADDNGDDFLGYDASDNVEANIAPPRRSIELTQEQIEYVQSAVNGYDNPSQRWRMQSSSSIASSLSDSIRINSDYDDEGSIERLEKCIEGGNKSKPASIPRRDSDKSLNLEDIFDGTEGSQAIVPAVEFTRRTYTASDKFDDPKSTKNKALSSSDQQERSNFESSESSSILDDCAWLPWPERRESIVEDKDNEATMQALYDDNSFLPWPDTPRNGRALAA
jgi:hypothetical protein